MEENKKRFQWKLNLFDLLVLAAALLAVVAVVFLRYQQQRQQAAQEDAQSSVNVTTVRYTIELTQLSLEVAQMIQPGDALVERTRGESLGTVESVSVGPSRAQVKNQYTGDAYYTEIPGKYTATIVLVSTATEDDRVIITEGIMGIRAGTGLRVYGPGYYGTGSILMVDRG